MRRVLGRRGMGGWVEGWMDMMNVCIYVHLMRVKNK
jgi:hypothetical protein